jgi:hypothetical protein
VELSEYGPCMLSMITSSDQRALCAAMAGNTRTESRTKGDDNCASIWTTDEVVKPPLAEPNKVMIRERQWGIPCAEDAVVAQIGH